MDKEIKNLLQQVLANQVIIYKRLEKVENKLKGSSRSAPIKSYVEELRSKSVEALLYIKNENL